MLSTWDNLWKSISWELVNLKLPFQIALVPRLRKKKKKKKAGIQPVGVSLQDQVPTKFPGIFYEFHQ